MFTREEILKEIDDLEPGDLYPTRCEWGELIADSGPDPMCDPPCVVASLYDRNEGGGPEMPIVLCNEHANQFEQFAHLMHRSYRLSGYAPDTDVRIVMRAHVNDVTCIECEKDHVTVVGTTPGHEHD